MQAAIELGLDSLDLFLDPCHPLGEFLHSHNRGSTRIRPGLHAGADSVLPAGSSHARGGGTELLEVTPAASAHHLGHRRPQETAHSRCTPPGARPGTTNHIPRRPSKPPVAPDLPSTASRRLPNHRLVPGLAHLISCCRPRCPLAQFR
jgi:hypothetical protein